MKKLPNSLNNSLIIAKALYVKSSARKIRRISNILIGTKVSEVLINLNFLNTKSSFILKKVISSAVANAKHNNNIKKTDKLIVKKIIVNEGPKKKKFFPRAKGRTDYIVKQTSHIIIALSPAQIIKQKKI